MKFIKKGIAVLLSVLVLALSLPLSAFASVDASQAATVGYTTQTISLNTPTNAVIANMADMAYFHFTPTETAIYEFYSNSSSDTVAYLCALNGSQLAYDDDGGENYNFKIQAELTAGVTYEFRTRYYDSNATGSFEVVLVKCSDQDLYEYSDNGDGTVTIIGSNYSVQTYNIPSEIDGKTVIGVAGLSNLYNADTIVFPDSVEFIGDSVIKNARNLKNVTFGSGVSNLDMYMFENSYSLTSITVSTSNPYFTVYEGVLYNKEVDTLIAIPTSSIRTYNVPSTVSNLDALELSIYSRIEVIYPSNHSRYVTIDGVTYTKDMTTVISCVKNKTGSYVMPDTVTTISDRAFERTRLSEVTISSRVSEIVYCAFYSCASLQKVNLPESVVSIGLDAFYGCYNLTSIDLPESLEYIGESSFENSGLQSLTVPDSVKTIDYKAFEDTDIATLDLGNGVESIEYRAFAYIPVTTVVLPDSLSYLGGSAFFNCYNLADLTIGSGLNTIYEYTFAYTNLNVLTIPGTVKNIYAHAFYSAGLNVLNLEEGIEYIGDCAFANCNRLSKVIIPDSVRSIDNYAFSNCSQLSEVKLGNGIEILGAGVFRNSPVVDLDLGNKIEVISQESFYNTDIVTLLVPGSVTTIMYGAFAYCDELTSIELPISVQNIQFSAFEECVNLSTVYYQGSQADRENMNISPIGNEYFLNATWHYNGCKGNFDNACDEECNTCGAIRKAHVYNNPCDSTCVLCGAVREGHSFEWIIDKEATCGTDGSQHEECSVCGFVRNVDTVIPATNNHNISPFTLINSAEYPFAFDGEVYSSTNHESNSVSRFTIEVNCDAELIIQYRTSTEENFDCLVIGSGEGVYSPIWTDSGETDWQTSHLQVFAGETIVIIYSKDGSVSHGDDTVYFKILNETPACDEQVNCYVCGAVAKEAFEHTYSDDLDPNCNVCGYERYECEHTYTSNYDTECNICGETRAREGEMFILGAFTYEITPDADGGYATIVDCEQSVSGEVVIPETIYGATVKEIGESAFYACYNITSVVIPESVVSIGYGAFRECDNLVSATISKNVTYIGEGAFHGLRFTDIYVSPENEYYSSLGGVLFNKDQTELIYYPMGNSNTFYTVPDSVVVICQNAISNGALREVVLPDSVAVLSNGAFAHCYALETITIPSSVVEIAANAFNSCYDLTSIIVDEDNAYYSSLDGVLFNKEQTELLCFPTSSNMTSYVIPNTVTVVGNYAFNYCYNLSSLTIPNGVVDLGDSTFFGCSALTDIVIPEGVTCLDNYMFSWCSNLTNVTLPQSLQSINYDAFYMCEKLSNVYYEGTQEQAESLIIADGNDYLVNATWHCWDSEQEGTPDCDHTYDNSCDAYCNSCGEKRDVEDHVYDDIYDAICNICGAVRSVPERPSVPDEAPSFTVNGATVKAGDTFTVDVKINNNPGICAFQVGIGYNAELLELVSTTNGVFAGAIFGPQDNNPFQINWVNALSENTSNGVIATLTFRVREGAALGATDITISYDPNNVYDFDFENVYFETQNGVVNIIDYTPGDVNNDGKINNRDIGILQRYTCGWDVSVIEPAADVNDDGVIDNKDIGILERYVNGWDLELK